MPAPRPGPPAGTSSPGARRRRPRGRRRRPRRSGRCRSSAARRRRPRRPGGPRAVAYQAHDTPLNDRLRERGGNGVGEAGQAVDAGDEDVADAAVPQVGHDAAPEAGALALGRAARRGAPQPDPQDVLLPVGVDADRDAGGLVLHHLGVADLDHDRVQMMARPAKGNRISGPGVIGTAYHSRREAELRRAAFRAALIMRIDHWTIRAKNGSARAQR